MTTIRNNKRKSAGPPSDESVASPTIHSEQGETLVDRRPRKRIKTAAAAGETIHCESATKTTSSRNDDDMTALWNQPSHGSKLLHAETTRTTRATMMVRREEASFNVVPTPPSPAAAAAASHERLPRLISTRETTTTAIHHSPLFIAPPQPPGRDAVPLARSSLSNNNLGSNRTVASLQQQPLPVHNRRVQVPLSAKSMAQPVAAKTAAATSTAKRTTANSHKLSTARHVSSRHPALPSARVRLEAKKSRHYGRRTLNLHDKQESWGNKAAGVTLKILAVVIGMALWSMAAYFILTHLPSATTTEKASFMDVDDDGNEYIDVPQEPCFVDSPTAVATEPHDYSKRCIQAAVWKELVPCPSAGVCERGELLSCGPSDLQHAFNTRDSCGLHLSEAYTVESMSKLVRRVTAKQLCASDQQQQVLSIRVRNPGPSTTRTSDFSAGVVPMFDYHDLMNKAYYSVTETIDWDGTAKWLDYALDHGIVQGLALERDDDDDGDDTLWIGLTPQSAKILKLPTKCQVKRQAAFARQTLHSAVSAAARGAAFAASVAWDVYVQMPWTTSALVLTLCVLGYKLLDVLLAR